ncbi:hypothetical protein SAMN02745823_01013 [Sporobacter termitidis DSM 10068]|uniref:Uncharacterized protein n=2 Tax=Sporobacter TaxID=44748 RepID=A0A1M5VTX4_9FIRM|nr:hypothetical protein SAMN02745823_01013 [Sporobacter termitidis DSM 10068]
MIGLGVGIVSGCIQFWLLTKFTTGITTGKLSAKSLFFGLLQFVLPMGVLVAMAFIKRSDLLWTAVGIVGSLIICAVSKFVINTRRTRGREDKNV